MPVIWVNAPHDRQPKWLCAIAPQIDARVCRAGEIADLIA
jgi:hypothetical protein